MEWIKIDWMGTEIEAIDFLDGILVRVEGSIVGWQGYRVEEQHGDWDQARLTRRIKKSPTLSLQIVENE